MDDIAKTPKKWMVDDAGTLLDTEEPKYYDYPDEIVHVLNNYEHGKHLDQEVITSLRNKTKRYEKLLKVQNETIEELKYENLELKSKASTKEKMLKELYERNVNLERQNQALIDKLCEYEDEEI